jgi:replicative DNA helicase
MYNKIALSLIAPLIDHISDISMLRTGATQGKTPFPLTHYTELDRLIGLPRRGTLYSIAARPAMGKTSLALNILLRSAALGIRTLYISADMHIQFLMFRLLGLHTGVSLSNIGTGRLAPEERSAVSLGMDFLAHQPIFILDAYESPSWGPLRYRIDKVLCDHSIKLFIFDSIQRFGSHCLFNRISGAIATSALTDLRGLAEKTQSIGMIVSGMNRAIEYRRDRTPLPTDILRGEKLASMFQGIIFLDRPDMLSPVNSTLPDTPGRRVENLSVSYLERGKRRNSKMISLNFDQESLCIKEQ